MENTVKTPTESLPKASDEQLGLRKTPIASDPLPASMSQVSLVDGATTTPPPLGKQSSGSLLGGPDDETILRKPQKRVRIFTYILVGIAVLATGFFGGWLGAASYGRTGSASVVKQKTVLSNEATVISEIAGEVGQSVVSVNVTSQTSTASNPYAYYWGYGGGSQSQQSAGTGVILNDKGLILTNRHVVPSGTTAVSVTLSDGTVLDGVKVVGRTSSTDSLDIAFLQVGDAKGHKLVPAKLGDSSTMKVGDTVVAIGNALGQFQNTVTSGIISGYGRSIQAGDGTSSATETLDDLFQTDAAINEGNSGGPLVNLAGEVIGINTAIASNSQSVGFAIPINNVSGLIASVEETGKLERPYLGIVYVMLTDDVAKEYGLSVTRGAYVPRPSEVGGATVIAGGPADAAGVEAGDVITKIDGVKIDEKNSLMSILGKHKVGDKVELTIVRGDTTKTLTATLVAAPTDE